MPDISSELTFVFTDIEASTRKWEEHPGAMATAVDLHDRILGEAVTAHGGTVIKLTGDGLFARFDVPADAIAAFQTRPSDDSTAYCHSSKCCSA